jgi:class 3 adenylate cyclase
MPGMDGYEVCRRLRRDSATAILPVVMVTALDPTEERVKGLEAGADDFLTKPINQAELLARVRSLVRIKTLFDTVQTQKTELEAWSHTLEQRVQAQVEELERLGRLRRFLSPQIADMIVSAGEQSYLESHRRLIATVFCDLRGFTEFSELVEPEEAMNVLQTYHEVMGELIARFEGTISHRAGDGIMIIFNDPIACDRPAVCAVRMALAMRRRMAELQDRWLKLGYQLGFGIGISLGYATLGMVGYEGRYDYTANGSVVNLASRLCDEAGDGQILISQRLFAEIEGIFDAEPVAAELALKGFHRPMPIYDVVEGR